MTREKAAKKNKGRYKVGFLDKKPSSLDISLSIRHLSLMLKSGLALGDAIKVLADKSGKTTLDKIFIQVAQDIDHGKSLSESMGQFGNVFSEIIISIVDVGEQAGTLEDNLAFLADYLKSDYTLKKKVRGALVYPAVVFTLTLGELLGVVFFVLPKLESFFSAFEDIPAFTVFVMNAARFVRENIFLIVGGAVALILLIMMFFRSKPGEAFWDRVSLNLPVINNLVKGDVLARFSRTLGVLLKSGIPISNSMKISAVTTGNVVYNKLLEEARQTLKGGEHLADVLVVKKKYFPRTYIKMIEAGEGTGTLEDNLMYLYEYYSNEVQDMANNLTTLLEPVLLVVIGAMIGLLALIIVAPIYQLTGSITN